MHIIKVGVCEMKKANYPDTLVSGGMGPCIAIGVYDPKTRSGYMMHEPDFLSVDLSGKLQEIQRISGIPERGHRGLYLCP